jgi:hypothetical protein
MNNYPAGAEYDSNAPWNQNDQEPVGVDVLVSTTLSKHTTIETADYTPEYWEDYDIDDEGHTIHNGGMDYNFSDCNFIKDYREQEFTPKELLDVLIKYLKAEIVGEVHKEGSIAKRLLNSCENWTEDELEVIED